MVSYKVPVEFKFSEIFTVLYRIEGAFLSLLRRAACQIVIDWHSFLWQQSVYPMPPSSTELMSVQEGVNTVFAK